MKGNNERINIEILCKCFSMSRQAYYQHECDLSKKVFKSIILLDKINDIRKRHPKIGTRKLQIMLNPFMQENGIKMGRDALFDFLYEHKLLIHSQKRNIKTTNSFHWLKKYPNLTVGFKPSKPNKLWVSDITYWKTGGITFYISLITDAYSRKIVGYHLSENLQTNQTIKALNMAFSDAKKHHQSLEELIHHSDRGVQYCSNLYVNLLKKNDIKISMTQSGDPLENAIAERVNGIIKEEYLLNNECNNVKEARKLLAKVVSLYNEERPHNSIGNLTPENVHNQYNKIEKEKIERLWKNYYRKKLSLQNQNGIEISEKIISMFNG